ncbi:MAG: signal peptide peptidase SppA [Kiritimatiellaeota bacterium]|nr:signal peptide peptidase SppA [Kiritimatiellota bacterium]
MNDLNNSDSDERVIEPEIEAVGRGSNDGSCDARVEKKTATKKRHGCFWWFSVVIASLVVFSVFMFFLVMMLGILFSFGKTSDLPSFSASGVALKEGFLSGNAGASNKIVVIDIKGIIANVESGFGGGSVANPDLICAEIARAAEDDSVKAVILRVDTPGGEVTAADTIYHAIREFSMKTKKPVVASMGSLAASGGVYVAVAADYIIANRLTTTGSIGVIAQTYNYEELLRKIGLKSEVFKSGPMKDLLNGARPTTEAEREIIQAFIDEVYGDFVKIVADRRTEISEEMIRTTPIGDGRIYSGRQALKYGLIDQLGYFNDAVEKAASLASLKKSKFKVVEYKRAFSFSDFFAALKSEPPTLKLQLPGVRGNIVGRGKFFLLPKDL